MQVSIVLEGETYALVPSFEALSKVEETLQQSVTTLAIRLSDGELMLAELSFIVSCCMVPPMPQSFVAKALLTTGVSQVMQALAQMFALLFDDDSDEGVTRTQLDALIERFPDSL
jgi:hypothetical protein